MQAGFCVIFDILSGDDGLLMMCLLWINAQRMTGCINDLYNTSQQFCLILVVFPRVHCNKSSRMEKHVNILWLDTGLHPPLHCLSFSFSAVRYRSGYRQLLWGLGKGAVCKARGCAVTEPVLRFSLEITVSLTVTHSHKLVETEEIDKGQRDLELEGWRWT